MSEIIKTEAVVLSKMDYRDTSKIATFFTLEHGKMTGIIKGARSSKSGIGKMVDSFNHINLVIYKKSTRDLQYITQADFISFYPSIKSDLEKLKYSSAVLELVQALTVEEEAHPRLFRGIIKILGLFENSSEPPAFLLIKFILFFLKEIGYEFPLKNCSSCRREINPQRNIYFSYGSGIVCEDCRNGMQDAFLFSKELFNFFICLRNNKSNTDADLKMADKALFILERFLKHHIPLFRGIKSIHLY